MCIEWLLNHKLRNSNENRKIFWVDFVEIIIIAVCSDLPLISLSLLQKEYDECWFFGFHFSDLCFLISLFIATLRC